MPKATTTSVTVTTAQKLTAAQRASVHKLVEAKLGRHCTLVEVVDPAVVGGVRIAIGDQLFDATVAGKLERLQPQLQTVSVTTAEPLTANQRTTLTKGLEKSLAEPFQLKEVVDPTVLGGMRLMVGSVEFDGTLRKSLDALRHTLLQN